MSTSTTKSGSGGKKYSDKRREKSKIAARCRRGQESEIFTELAESLPFTDKIRSSLDKASIVRLILCDLKLENMLSKYCKNMCPLIDLGSQIGSEFESNIFGALGDGFVIIISANGDIIYVSENISVSLGLTQYEVMGRSIYEFSHPCDQRDVKNLLVVNKSQAVANRSGLIRLKCTLTSRGGCVHIRAASDKVIHFTGKLYLENLKDEQSWFIGIGESIPYPSDDDVQFKEQTFQSKHSPDLKCISADESVEKLVGYKVNEMVGKSLFEFQHAADAKNLASLFRALFIKGQIRTERYRFLAKNGGWIWAVTEASLLKPNSSAGSSTVVCRHSLIGEVQNRSEILSTVQICDEEQVQINNEPVPPLSPDTSEYVLPLILTDVVFSPPTTPIPNTAKIFAPRTDDMDSGFLMPFGIDGEMTKNNDDVDLTHLAPIAGDECVPLSSELYEDFLKLFDAHNSDYRGESVIGMDELDFLNASSDVNLIPLDNIPGFENTPLMQESDPLFGISGPCENLINFNDETASTDQNDNQIDHDYFECNDIDINTLMSLADELSLPLDPSYTQTSPFINPESSEPIYDTSLRDLLPSLDSLDANIGRSPIPHTAASREINKTLAEIEGSFLKRKARCDLPRVVTKFIFGDQIPPKKFPRLSSATELGDLARFS